MMIRFYLCRRLASASPEDYSRKSANEHPALRLSLFGRLKQIGIQDVS